MLSRLAMSALLGALAGACRPPTAAPPEEAPAVAASESVGVAEVEASLDVAGPTKPATTPEPLPPAPTPAAPEPLEPVGSLVPAHAGFPPKRASEATCNALGEEATALIDTLHAPCAHADDCELRASACPFGCYQIISKRADLGATTAAIDRFYRRCPMCKNKCRTPPSELACIDGRCVDPRDLSP